MSFGIDCFITNVYFSFYLIGKIFCVFQFKVTCLCSDLLTRNTEYVIDISQMLTCRFCYNSKRKQLLKRQLMTNIFY